MNTIEEAYALIPDVPCKGLCQQACGPIGCSDAEAQRLQENGINLPTVVDHPTEGALTCSHLSPEGRCNVYENRPLVCRLFGAVKAMACPHGCKPKGGYMSDAQAAGLRDSLDNITGRPPYVVKF